MMLGARYRLFAIAIVMALLPSFCIGSQAFIDKTHLSKIFGEPRHYRILLPPGYETSGKAYPVIYYFHGHSDRYTVERYDNGTDTIPKMAGYVARNDVIVVCVDGYVAKDYTGFYGGAPWDVFASGGEMDFGAYFPELVAHIDSSYRTLTDRRHRGVSGLSMGGFMSLYLSARLPEFIGSASAFNPGPEFYCGEAGRRVLWRPKDHVASHAHSMVRLIRASGDYISQYHEETRDAYARASQVDFEYRVDEYHRHWATSIEETFDFHKRAFARPELNNTPEFFSYSNPYASFQVWGYRVEAPGTIAGFTYLEDVSQWGMRLTTRRWAPDGPPVPDRKITVITAPLYKPGARYTVLDYSLTSGTTESRETSADGEGRLTVAMSGAGHQVSFIGPGTGAHPPVILPVPGGGVLRLSSQVDVALPLRVYNPRGEPMTDVHVALTSAYPTVKILAGDTVIPKIGPGEAIDVSREMILRLTAGNGYFAPARLDLKLTYDGWYEKTADIDILAIPENVPAPLGIEVLDGRKATFKVFRQAGNQGGGAIIDRTVNEGKGNGNGVLEPGEEATVWVKLAQGLDPFDKNTWHRCKVYSDSRWLAEIGDIQEDKQREWTGARERTSLVRLAPEIPSGTAVPVLLDNESWSFYYTPDVRYGAQPLYQAFQFHSHHLHRYEFAVRSK